MPRNSKKDEARHELLQLLKGLEFYRTWMISGIKAARGEVRQEDLDSIVLPSEFWLETFDSAGSHYAEVLQGVLKWYSHTYSDLCYMANVGGEAVSSEIRKFFKDFRSEIGFDFHSKAYFVAKSARKVLKRGKISKERDYYILKELEGSVDQTLLNDIELEAVSNMLRKFENNQ